MNVINCTTQTLCSSFSNGTGMVVYIHKSRWIFISVRCSVATILKAYGKTLRSLSMQKIEMIFPKGTLCIHHFCSEFSNYISYIQSEKHLKHIKTIYEIQQKQSRRDERFNWKLNLGRILKLKTITCILGGI